VMALIEEPDGFRIATLNPEMERQVKAMNKVLREQFNGIHLANAAVERVRRRQRRQ